MRVCVHVQVANLVEEIVKQRKERNKVDEKGKVGVAAAGESSQTGEASPEIQKDVQHGLVVSMESEIKVKEEALKKVRKQQAELKGEAEVLHAEQQEEEEQVCDFICHVSTQRFTYMLSFCSCFCIYP